MDLHPRAKGGHRFRPFSLHDSKVRIIVYAWVNDAQILRSAGSKTDPYTAFERILANGYPPTDWAALVAVSQRDWPD
ncbi:type II toxin-antitoxin system YhaV family toxin [Elstera sp.]|uniref:type II toxin-antitoxin system YhaV family toxin n=1 Tax=Elstera sp. TaxID=1916664 RepID=UPI0037C19AE6